MVQQGSVKTRLYGLSVPDHHSHYVVKSVTIAGTKEERPEEGRITCSTKNFLYLLWSGKDPDIQYCGSSGREVRARDIGNQVLTTTHFHSTGIGVEDLVVVPFQMIE